MTLCVHALSGTEVRRLFKLFRGSKGSSICPQPEAQRELKRLLRVDVAYACICPRPENQRWKGPKGLDACGLTSVLERPTDDLLRV